MNGRAAFARRAAVACARLAACALLAACRHDAPSADAARPPVALASSAEVEAPPRPSPRATDAAWTRARGDDALEHERLALHAGATELLEGVTDGGELARTALLALPFADDADLALGGLASLALAEAEAPGRRAATGEVKAPLRALLQAILAVAGRPRQPRELLDPEGVRASAEAVVALAQRKSLDHEARALAVSAARALAEKGYVDAARIPGDLDRP